MSAHVVAKLSFAGTVSFLQHVSRLEVCERIQDSSRLLPHNNENSAARNIVKSASLLRVNPEVSLKTKMEMGEEWKKCWLSIYLQQTKIIKLSFDLLQDKALVLKAITILTRRYFLNGLFWGNENRINFADLFSSTTARSERETNERRAILYRVHTDGPAKQIHKIDCIETFIEIAIPSKGTKALDAMTRNCEVKKQRKQSSLKENSSELHLSRYHSYKVIKTLQVSQVDSVIHKSSCYQLLNITILFP